MAAILAILLCSYFDTRDGRGAAPGYISNEGVDSNRGLSPLA
jgi:hypothetical protein